jgi:hypothetical protein
VLVVTGVLGAGLVVLEGVRALSYFVERWIGYRPAAGAPGRERHLYQARAEGLLARERAGWVGSGQAAGWVPGGLR